MSEITKEVVLDLLPLYIADEVSDDTRALVDEYLETDPELAQIAKKLVSKDLSVDIPIPLTRENNLKAYSQARQAIVIRTIIIIASILIVLLVFGALLTFFLVPVGQ